eukprot:CAMPEP_0176081890 /NCGR_PEP_ID=MMETSP0120_2-20121206/40962_1 /TAXON_ID=160619 /ORGANISM="Kryptoperidinium foliaceum, Strain CCMP 1326" /LENGTH=254 /DNA_ID=CAMNT_0017415657 /DNA_START=121 /DNA_END=885 /DNA_ORIENTATION=+
MTRSFLFAILAPATFHATSAFVMVPSSPSISSSKTLRSMSTTTADGYVVDPFKRNAIYDQNMAQYLVDLHDSEATFDFCGGMMFQLVLSDALREHLVKLASNEDEEAALKVAKASKYRMHQLEDYAQSASADNLGIFHGREIRRVPWAQGGMGFVLHLSLADAQDPEGWTTQEIQGYDGWRHDVGRDWRTGDRLEREGFDNFRKKFGPDSFSLNHRFYLHWDGLDRLWLSAEDGCEGTPVAKPNPIQSFFNKLL